MSGIVKGMTDAVKGEGGTLRNMNPRTTEVKSKQLQGGLQGISGAAGEILGGSSDTRSSDGKKSDDATKSIKELGQGNAR